MMTHKFNLTVDELDQLCRLYMDCKLSVMEEKELEYVLTQSSLTSPSIDVVRSLMGVQAVRPSKIKPRSRRNWNWRSISGIAASVSIIISAAFYMSHRQDALHSTDESTVYIAAYSNGQHLNDGEAIVSTNIAMAKADALMDYASLAERDYMMRANNIISETFNN